MTETPDDAWLIALGSAISDGAPLDWDELERHAPDTRSKRIVRQMRGLSRIVDAHRSDGADEGEPSGAPASSAARHWRHIVLFEAVGAGAFGTVHRGWDPTLE